MWLDIHRVLGTKVGPGTQDPGTWYPGPGAPGPQDPEPETQDLGPRTP